MSKLFKLKEWLTIPEAINYISLAIGETITEADVYRLVLDKHLILSVNLVNGACAYTGKFVNVDEVLFTVFEDILGEKLETPIQLPINNEIPISNEKYIHLDRERIKHIIGVWDLTLLGNEGIDVEFIYHKLTSGIEVTLGSFDGVFLNKGDVVSQLQTDFDDNEYQKGSKSYCNMIEASIDHENTSLEKINEIRSSYKKERLIYLEKRKKQSESDLYFPSGGLDEHEYVFVIRTEEIHRFLTSLEAPSKIEKIHERMPESSLLDSIGIMAWLLSKKVNTFKISDRPNANQILKGVQTVIDQLGLNDEENKIKISNLNRDISLALKQLEGKLNIK